MCEPCALDTYAPVSNLSECFSCGVSGRALSLGGTACICAAAYGRSSVTVPCEPCEFGYFKESAGDEPCSPALNLETSGALSSILIALQALSLLGSASLGALMLHKRKVKVVNAASWRFMALIAVGKGYTFLWLFGNDDVFNRCFVYDWNKGCACSHVALILSLLTDRPCSAVVWLAHVGTLSAATQNPRDAKHKQLSYLQAATG